jgi:outer membrane lipoprotein carrier protein
MSRMSRPGPIRGLLKTGRLLVAGIGFVALFNPAVAAWASAPEGPLSDLVQKVQSRYERTVDWKADFHQLTVIEGFDSPIRSRGTVYIKKPGKLRWDYLEPNQHQIWVNENKVWIFTPEQNQVIVSPFEEISDSQLPLHLLSGIGRLDRDFDVQRTPSTDKSSAAVPALTLVPKDPGTGLTKLLIELDPDSYFIIGLTLYESNGNRSQFRFMAIKSNTGLKDHLFAFKPPKDIVVIESPRLKH